MVNQNGETEGGWTKWGTHVLIELQRLNTNLEKLQESVNGKISDIVQVMSDYKYEINSRINETEKEISVIKTRAATYGAVAGVVISFIAHYLLAIITKG